MIRVERHRIAAGDLLERFAAAEADERFYWERPDRGEAAMGVGVAAAIEAAGARRFEICGRQARDLWRRTRILGEAPAFAGPWLVGGFAFDPEGASSLRWSGFPAARLVLPARLDVQRGGVAWRCETTPDSPGAASGPRPAHASVRRDHVPSFHARSDGCLGAFRCLVADAVEAIRRGELEKVVVARSATVVAERGFDLAHLLRNLRAQHPSCTLFAFARRGVVLLGASPETLVRLEGGRVFADVVAGSAPRGRSADEDLAHARALRESKKEQEEHAVVLRAVRAALGAHCSVIEAPESPRLLRTEGIQHLYTPVTATPRDPAATSVLTLVEALHPTPAVGGTPRDAALRWIAAHEPLERGWYAGPVGWMDARGEGEFAVALRLALMRGCEASLFAGAGIVEGSDPELELRETRLKLRSVLGTLLEI